MTATQLAEISGVLLSLLLAYFPGLAKWYDAKDAKTKAQLMGGLLVLVSLAIFGLACANILADFGLNVACTRAGIIQLVQILLAALVANQATFLLAVRPFKS